MLKVLFDVSNWLGGWKYIIEVPVDGKMVRESSVAATITYTYLSTSSVFIAPRLQLFHLSLYSWHIPKETELLFNLICELEEHLGVYGSTFEFLSLFILDVSIVMKLKTMNGDKSIWFFLWAITFFRDDDNEI